MSNKFTNLMKRFLENPKLNREKFVKNKQIYNVCLNKNRQKNVNIINRKMSTYSYYGMNDGGGGGGRNRLIYMIIMSTTCYLINKRFI